MQKNDTYMLQQKRIPKELHVYIHTALPQAASFRATKKGYLGTRSCNSNARLLVTQQCCKAWRGVGIAKSTTAV
jgi:hypothetical protein